MIKALLVDDEHLVRKGLLHILPWAKYGIEVVGEAGNGEEALEFLDNHNAIQLLVTDLTMPVMDGFELIRRVKEKLPGLFIVIITCHRYFEHAQEAVRLGAIDYIVKTQLEDDVLDNVFARIQGRIREEMGKASAKLRTVRRNETERAYLMIPQTENAKFSDLFVVSWLASERKERIGDAWLVFRTGTMPMEEDFAALLPHVEPNWKIICLHQLEGCVSEVRRSILGDYMKRLFFYERKAGKTVYHESLNTLVSSPRPEGKTRWKKQWKLFRWLFDDEALAAWENEVLAEKPTTDELLEVIVNTVRSWSLSEQLTFLKEKLSESEKCNCWEEWVSWLKGIRSDVRQLLHASSNSTDVTASILQALEYARERLVEGINQEEVAAHVGLSRGYFSFCFKQVTGTSFQDYMRALRVETAKALLLGKQVPLSEIAVYCGFQDDQYFRKLFREQTGMTPKEYRTGRTNGTADHH